MIKISKRKYSNFKVVGSNLAPGWSPAYQNLVPISELKQAEDDIREDLNDSTSDLRRDIRRIYKRAKSGHQTESVWLIPQGIVVHIEFDLE